MAKYTKTTLALLIVLMEILIPQFVYASGTTSDVITTVTSFGETGEFLGSTTETLAISRLAPTRVRVFHRYGFAPVTFYEDVETTRITSFLLDGRESGRFGLPKVSTLFRSMIKRKGVGRLFMSDAPCVGVAYWDGEGIQVVGFWGPFQQLLPYLTSNAFTEDELKIVQRLYEFISKNESGWKSYP